MDTYLGGKAAASDRGESSLAGVAGDLLRDGGILRSVDLFPVAVFRGDSGGAGCSVRNERSRPPDHLTDKMFLGTRTRRKVEDGQSGKVRVRGILSF